MTLILPLDESLHQTRRGTGSWWPDLAAWLGERSGEHKPAPDELGNERFGVIEDAPGSYVLDS